MMTILRFRFSIEELESLEEQFQEFRFNQGGYFFNFSIRSICSRHPLVWPDLVIVRCYQALHEVKTLILYM